METREQTICRGESYLTNKHVCPICRGLGSYLCIHCKGKDSDCSSCGGDDIADSRWVKYAFQHICSCCSGHGKRTPPEELYAEDSGLRDVNLDGYRLQLWDTGKHMGSGPQFRAHYRLTSPDGEVLFEGSDYGSSPMDAIDSDETVRGIINFLTLSPGDTDSDYFSNYTEAQWAFANNEAEELCIWALEPEHTQLCLYEDHKWQCVPDCPTRESFPDWDEEAGRSGPRSSEGL